MATQKLNNFCKKICWTNLLFILLTPVVAVIGITWLYSRGGSHWGAWVLLPVMMGLTGLGITAGYHRLFSHRSYQAHWLVRLFYLLFGGACFEGSVREWCQAHRRHHQYTDKEGDPYNAKKGFLYSHILWIFLKSDQSDLSNIQDLLADQLVRWQDRYYVVLAVLFGFGLPTGVAALWGDPWGGLFIAGVLRVVLNHHLTWLINSYCHFVGRQTYSDQVTARDSGFISLFTYGEGFHNFHHAFQADYRNGVRAFHWDPSKWLIFLLSKMGLTKNLRRIPAPAILAARLRMDEKRLREFMLQRERWTREAEEWIARRRVEIEQIHARLLVLQKQYRELKRTKVDSMQDKIHEIRLEMNHLRGEFKLALRHWRLVLKQPTFVFTF